MLAVLSMWSVLKSAKDPPGVAHIISDLNNKHSKIEKNFGKHE